MTFSSAAQQCVSVSLVNDGQNESDESFKVRVTGQSGDYSNFIGIITIIISGGSNGGTGMYIML